MPAYSFKEGEILRFDQQITGNPERAILNMQIPGSTKIPFANNGVPNPAFWRFKLDLPSAEAVYFLHASATADAQLKVNAICKPAGDVTPPDVNPPGSNLPGLPGFQSPIGDETQNTGMATSFEQTKRMTSTLNRALAERLAAPGGTDSDSSTLQTSGWEHGLDPRRPYGLTPDAVAMGGDLSRSLANLLLAFEGSASSGNAVPVLNAAAQESTDSINNALRAVGHGNKFIFGDVTGTWLTDDRGGNDRDGDEVYGTLGFGYNSSDRLTIGLTGSYNWVDRPLTAAIGDQEISGWAINPFLAYRWREVVFSVSGGYGKQDNEVRVDEIPLLNADFDSDNYNIAGAVFGTLRRGAWWITPRGTLSYNWAEADAFTDAGGLPVPEQSENYGELAGNFRFGYDGLVTKGGTRVMPYIEPSVYWAFERPDTQFLTAGGTYRTSSFTGDIEGGLDFLMESGLKFSIGAGYSGIGEDDISRIILRGDLNWRF